MCVAKCECNHCYRKQKCADCEYNKLIEDVNCYPGGDGVQKCPYRIPHPSEINNEKPLENETVENDTCEWTETYVSTPFLFMSKFKYHTSCQDRTVSNNVEGYLYCPYCGKKIKLRNK